MFMMMLVIILLAEWDLPCIASFCTLLNLVTWPTILMLQSCTLHKVVKVLKLKNSSDKTKTKWIPHSMTKTNEGSPFRPEVAHGHGSQIPYLNSPFWKANFICGFRIFYPKHNSQEFYSQTEKYSSGLTFCYLGNRYSTRCNNPVIGSRALKGTRSNNLGYCIASRTVTYRGGVMYSLHIVIQCSSLIS